MRSRLRLFIPGFLIIAASCKGPGVLDCFESAGAYQEKEMELPLFREITAYDNIDLFISNGDSQKVIIKAGKHLIPNIQLTVESGMLTIHNRNSCNWVRGSGNPGIYIYSDSLEKVETYGFINIATPDTLHIDKFHLFTDGTGNFNFQVKGNSLIVESQFISDFHIAGAVENLKIVFTNDSQFFGNRLIAGNISVTHRGSNRVEVYPMTLLQGTIESTGSLYYYHEPAELNVKVTGTGKLVKKF